MAHILWDLNLTLDLLTGKVGWGYPSQKQHASSSHSFPEPYTDTAFSQTHDRHWLKALVYDILHSTAAIFSYTIGSRKLSANKQFFVGAQTVVSLLQTTQIKQGVSFIAANKVYTSTNKTTIVWIETELFLFYQGWMRLMFTCVLGR